MSDSLWPHELQYMSSLSFTISWSLLRLLSIELVMPSSHLILCHHFSYPQSSLAYGSFPGSQIFTSYGQSIGASPLAWVLRVIIQGWFPLGLTGLISLLSRKLSRVFSSTVIGKHQFFSAQPSLCQLSHVHMTTGNVTERFVVGLGYLLLKSQ